MQSFSYRVKEELAGLIKSNQKSRACLYGMLMFCNSFSLSSIFLLTENDVVANLFCKLIEKATGDKNAVSEKTIVKKNKVTLYHLEVLKPSKRRAIFDFFEIDGENFERRIDLKHIGKKKFTPEFIAGAFLVCGSVNDPLKEYHLELIVSTLDLCNDLGLILIDYGILAKHAERKNTNIVYLKESEYIEDMLTLMGAVTSSLEIMNVKILKNVRNKINRAVNCDNANIEKSIKAAERQIKDIEYIDEAGAVSLLTKELIEIAEIRLENPDYNLKELGEACNPPISRSGANHRLTKISEIAKKIRDKEI